MKKRFVFILALVLCAAMLCVGAAAEENTGSIDVILPDDIGTYSLTYGAYSPLYEGLNENIPAGGATYSLTNTTTYENYFTGYVNVTAGETATIDLAALAENGTLIRKPTCAVTFNVTLIDENGEEVTENAPEISVEIAIDNVWETSGTNTYTFAIPKESNYVYTVTADGYTTAQGYILLNEDNPQLDEMAINVTLYSTSMTIDSVRNEEWATDANTLYINDLGDLAQFHYLSNTGYSFEGKTIVLANDIDASGISDWTGLIIGENVVFDGDGHTVNYRISQIGTNENYGLVATNNGTVMSVSASGSILGSEVVSKIIGGMVACNYGTVKNCESYVRINANDSFSKSYIGGIVGYSEGNILYCNNYGDIESRQFTTYYIGGVAGAVTDGALFGCKNEGNLRTDISSGSAGLGGIVGVATVDIYNCWNAGSVYAPSEYKVGGIAGEIQNNLTFKSCLNTGDVSHAPGSDGPYAICGFVDENYGDTLTCVNTWALENSGKNFVEGMSDIETGCNWIESVNTQEFADTLNNGQTPPVWVVVDGELTLGRFEYDLDVKYPTFADVTVGYTQPAAQAIAITNNSGFDITGVSVEIGDTEHFTLTDGKTSIANGETDTSWTIQPAEGLEVGEYSTTVTVIYPGGELTGTVTFTVKAQPVNVPDTYDITLTTTDGGEAKTSLSNASAGTTITVTATPDEGYELAYITVDGERISGTTFTMPAHDVTVRVYFASAALPFTDVATGAWYYDAVEYVYANGLMDGVSATQFAPDGTMTRAMVWAILARIDGETVTGSNWAEAARAWAVSSGVSDGENPDASVTREQLATMLWRCAGEPDGTAPLSAWRDAASVSGWAAEAMSWAIDNGIITGVSDDTLSPQGTAARAQCAAMLMRFMQA